MMYIGMKYFFFKKQRKEQTYFILFIHQPSVLHTLSCSSLIKDLLSIKQSISLFHNFFYSMLNSSHKEKAKSSAKLQTSSIRIKQPLTPEKVSLPQASKSNIISSKKMQYSPMIDKSEVKGEGSKTYLKSEKSNKTVTCSVASIFRKIVDGVGSHMHKSEKSSEKGKEEMKDVKTIKEDNQAGEITQTTEDNSKRNKNQYYVRMTMNSETNILDLEPKKLVKKLSQKEKDPILQFINLEHKTIGDKINYHLDVLSIMADFVESWWRSNEDEDEWEELNFLIYKKFYLERLKVQNFLRKYPIRNPFKLNNAYADVKQILTFMKLSTGKIRLQKISIENLEILQKLRDYYNVIIAKSGGHINLLEEDNFSEFLHKQLWNCFIMLEFCSRISEHRKMTKLCRILQIGFIIAELEGKAVGKIEEADVAIKENSLQEYVEKYRRIYESTLIF